MNKILIIGCGSIGQRHIKALLNIGEQDIAAYRTFKGALRQIPKEIEKNIKIFTNEDNAFNWKPTHVIISNPTKHHLYYLIKALRNGLNVFVEKPVIESFSNLKNETESYSELSRYNAFVGYNLRFHSIFQKIWTYISENTFGKVITAKLEVGHYLPFWHPYEDYRKSYAALKELGGGVLRTLSHEIDLAQFLFGKINKLFAKVEKISNLEINTDDCVDIVFRTQKCKRVLIHLDYLSPLAYRTGKLLFENGLLEYDYINGNIYYISYENKKKELIFNTIEDYNLQYKKQMQDFITEDFSIACDLAEGLKVSETIELCELSSSRGEEICLD